MPIEVKNFLTAQRAIGQIVTDATAHDADVGRAIETLTIAHAKLEAMGAAWTPAVQFINAQAVAYPDNAAWQSLKTQTDMIVADFISMRDRALAVRDAAIAAS